MNTKVIIVGAGIAGLTAAHELIDLGYSVEVYEANSVAGGFFRSARSKEHAHIPTEYSWHGFGPWYHNAFDILKRIPGQNQHNLFDSILSKPINFGLLPDKNISSISNLFNKFHALEFSSKDKFVVATTLLRVWASDARSAEEFAHINASDYFKSRLSEQGWKNWTATFGPWIGSDKDNVSLHHVGLFFQKNFFSGKSHRHYDQNEGTYWTHKSRDGWLVLNGPSNEVFFKPWVKYLESKGVKFHWSTPVKVLVPENGKLTSVQLNNGKTIDGDFIVLAASPFASEKIINESQIESLKDLGEKFQLLTSDGPHIQVSFRIGFEKKINWPVDRNGYILTDSEYNVTLFPQELAWQDKIDLGAGIESLWTGTACVSDQPGRVHGIPLRYCTRQQFIDEIKAQVLNSKGLQSLIKQANNSRSLSDFNLKVIEVWDEWQFSPNGISSPQPKWVTTTNTKRHRPDQKTTIENLFVAGAHTDTVADVWSIEGAVESGKRAAKGIDARVNVVENSPPLFLRVLKNIDNAIFYLNAPARSKKVS